MSVSQIIGLFRLWIDNLVPVLIGLALIFFIWNLIGLIRSGDESSREEAKKGMWSGILAMFVIISIWGIIYFIGKSLGIDPGGTGVAPQF
ncbi:MAG: hypothetical protein AAB590_02345 [Patescibacteria group bacterium]